MENVFAPQLPIFCEKYAIFCDKKNQWKYNMLIISKKKFFKKCTIFRKVYYLCSVLVH